MSPEDLLALGYIQSDFDDMCEPAWMWIAVKLHTKLRLYTPLPELAIGQIGQ